MNLKYYLLIILLPVGTGLFIAWLTGSSLFGLSGGVVMLVFSITDILKGVFKDGINQEAVHEIENRKTHTSNLRTTIELWQKKLQDRKLRWYESAEKIGDRNKFYEINLSFIDEIEKDTLIREKDIFYHFSELENLWDDFQDLINKYRLAKKELFNKIRNYTEEQLKKQKYDINTVFLEGFYVSIYKEIVVSIKGDFDEYGYSMEEFGVTKKYKIKYCKKDNNSAEFCHDLVEMQGQEEKEHVQIVHEKLIAECKKLYLKDAKVLVDIENRLLGKSGKLEQLEYSLEINRQIPLPKPNCKFIKEK
jgi:hypothetical protein